MRVLPVALLAVVLAAATAPGSVAEPAALDLPACAGGDGFGTAAPLHPPAACEGDTDGAPRWYRVGVGPAEIVTAAVSFRAGGGAVCLVTPDGLQEACSARIARVQGASEASVHDGAYRVVVRAEGPAAYDLGVVVAGAGPANPLAAPPDCGAATDAGEALDDALAVALDAGACHGSVGFFDWADWYAFDVPRRGALEIHVRDLEDTDVCLHAGDGTRLDCSIRLGDRPLSLVAPVAPGRYALSVTFWSGPDAYDFEPRLLPPPACWNEQDDDGDGLVDAEDPGCTDALDGEETYWDATCDDGHDNDGDGLTDWKTDGTGDPECASPRDQSEAFRGEQ